MRLSDRRCEILGGALNEATLLGFEIDSKCRRAGATLSVLSLTSSGDTPEDPRIQLVFEPVGRVAASLRLGSWDDSDAEVVPIKIENFLETVQSFGGLPVYGYEFFNEHEKELKLWGNRLSLDWRSGSDGIANSVTMFQAGGRRHLDFCVWFDELEIRNSEGSQVEIGEIGAASERWWSRLRSGDPKTKGYGIFPLREK